MIEFVVDGLAHNDLNKKHEKSEPLLPSDCSFSFPKKKFIRYFIIHFKNGDTCTMNWKQPIKSNKRKKCMFGSKLDEPL